jgi:hypothetical protein
MRLQPPKSFAEFWPVYVAAHNHPLTRFFHFCGTLLGWGLLICAIVLGNPWLLLPALISGYAFAWFSHFFVEHNRPATFGNPLWSWLADQKMVALMLTGRMSAEVRRCENSSQS